MATRVPSSPVDADVFSRLALRLRQVVREEHHNSLNGAEQFSVTSVAPLVIEQLNGSLVLQDGDPDFTVGAWVRQFMLNYTLVPGDLVWCLREGAQWHVTDIADPGGQHQLQAAP